MAQRFISPGVFTQENDLSFLPQGIAQIGGAFIGPTVKGPAFLPTIVKSQNEFLQKFGTPIPEFYVGNAVQDYLSDAAQATIVRVLGLTGYAPTESTPLVLEAVTSGSAVRVTIAAIFPSRNTLDVTPVAITTASVSGSITNFNLSMTNSNGQSSSFTGLSVDPTSVNYFAHALGTSPSSPSVGYVLLNFVRDYATVSASLVSTGSMVGTSGSTGEAALNFSGSTFGVYDHAATPFIQSQKIAGTPMDLFRVHSFSDGNASNNDIKVSISNVKPANSTADDQHGSFVLLVRAIDDTDSRINVLEQFDNLSLDPTSPNYIARVIGDQHWAIDSNGNLAQEGEFSSKSNFIYVEMVTGIENVPDTALPVGFAQLRSTLNLGSVLSSPVPFEVITRFEVPAGIPSGSTGSATESVENIRRFYGWDYTDNVDLALLNPIPSGAALIGTAFSLETSVSDVDVTAAFTASGGGMTVAGSNVRKFTVPLQGGFDGQNPSRVLATGADITNKNTQGFDLSLSTSPGSKAYQQAINAVSNDEAFDINLLVLPGVLRSLHPFVTQLAIDMCEARGDAFYIMDDVGLTDDVDTAVATVVGIDSNYVGTYHPWVKITDPSSNRLIWVPPSVVMPGVYAFNDKVAAEWFAPAGLNRGGITSAVQVRRRLDRDDRDTLYDGRVNPIALFPDTGIVAFGQKTLQVRASALDRINVRRLLIAVKKFVASTARFLVFEQNVEATRQRFLNIVNPYLASVQERAGLFAFKVIMDDSNNTPDLIDRNILVGQLFLQPTRTAEFISLEFNILPTGATFPTGA